MKRCQGKSRYSGLASCWTWSVCVSVCVCKTLFMHVCETIYLCMCVRLYFMYVCETTFMHMCETTLCNIQMNLLQHPLYYYWNSCNTQTLETGTYYYYNMFGLLLKHLKQVLNTLWNEEMTKIKFGDLNKLYNFYIHHLYSWNHLVFENQV